MYRAIIHESLFSEPLGFTVHILSEKNNNINLFDNRPLLMNEKYETKAQQSDGVYPSRHWLLKIESVGELLSKLAEPVFQPTPGLP